MGDPGGGGGAGGGAPPEGNVPAALLPNELERLAALRSLGVLESATPPDLQWLVEVCSSVFQVPICLVSLVEEDRQWFWAHRGLGAEQTGREESFCAHAMHNPQDSFVVLDTWEDSRFSRNVLVTGYPHIRFYAGMPLSIQTGEKVEMEPAEGESVAPGRPGKLCMGTLCLIDDRPRRTFSAHERDMLSVLSRMATDTLQAKVPSTQRKRTPSSSSGKLQQCGVAEEQAPLPAELLQFSQERDVLLVLGCEEGGRAPILVCSPGVENVLRRSRETSMGCDFRDLLYPGEGGIEGEDAVEEGGVLGRGAFEAEVKSLLAAKPTGKIRAESILEGWMPRERPPEGPGGRVWASLNLKFMGGGRLLVHLQDHTASAMELLSAKRGMATAEAAALAKSRFLANMSHELRTPMNAINACSLLLSEERLTVPQAELVQMIAVSCSQMLDLLNQVLDFSKLDSKRLRATPKVFEKFNGRHCVEGVLESLSIVASRKCLDFAYVIEDGIPDVWGGDEIQFRQVLLNLASNAVKFTERGHVSIYVKRKNATDKAGGSGDDGTDGEERLEIQVRDTGKGVPPEAIGVIFHPFEQVDSSLTRDISGTGLGLSISKMIVEGLGGQITAESVVGRGSTFACDFPFRLNFPRKRGSDQMDTPLVPKSSEILMVMQSSIIGEGMGSILSKLGQRHRCVTPSHASHLLAQEGSTSTFGLVVLDQQSSTEISGAWIECARATIKWAKAAVAEKQLAGGSGSSSAAIHLPVLLLKLHRHSGMGSKGQVTASKAEHQAGPTAAKGGLYGTCHLEPSPLITVPSDASIASGLSERAAGGQSALMEVWMDLWRGLLYYQLAKPVTLAKMQELLLRVQEHTSGSKINPLVVRHDRKARKTAEAQSGRDAKSEDASKGLRILVCEDNLVNQRVLIKILHSLGYSDVKLANNGAEGLKAVQESAFDIVLMDIHMPVMDGLQACKEITHPGTPCVGGQAPPVVALTADVVSDIRERCEKAGMVGFLKKPINRKDLAETIVRLARKN